MSFVLAVLFSIVSLSIQCGTNGEIDWRTKGAVLPVADQADCGSSAVINALDAISAKIQIRTGQLVKLSRQQIYDCSTYLGGATVLGNSVDDLCPCEGSSVNVTQVYQLIESKNISHGLQPDDKYPYTGQCLHKCGRSLTNYTLDSYVSGPDDVNLENNLSCWLETGPVAVNVHAACPELQMYTGGVFKSTDCKGQPDHIMLLVGYGSESGQDYWIARNSWGANWGEQGYIRILRGHNILGIGYGCTLPL